MYVLLTIGLFIPIFYKFFLFIVQTISYFYYKKFVFLVYFTYLCKKYKDMNDKQIIESLIRDGFTNSEIAKVVKSSFEYISIHRANLGLPTTKTIKLLNKNPEFETYFKNIHDSNTIRNTINTIQKHPLFLRVKFNNQRLSELRKFYKIEPKMPELTYHSNYDRIRGYIIRNSKFMAKRRGLKFNLKYDDFEIPEYCPLLNVKLRYLKEEHNDGNNPYHASLDRIDNSKGYIKGNVIVISRLANAMKNAATLDQLLVFCKNTEKLINHYKNQGALGSITDVFDDFSPKLSLDS